MRTRTFQPVKLAKARRRRREGASRLAFELLEHRQLLTVFVVRNTSDTGQGSLRQAILDANDLSGPDEIQFLIDGSGVQTIAPGSPLPDVTDTVDINGYSQPGASPNTLESGDDRVLMIELHGSDAGEDADGLRFVSGSSGSTLRGLIVNGFDGNGVVIQGANSVTIAGNLFGTDSTGTEDRGNAGAGILVELGSGNVIGGTAASARNIISGNQQGVLVRSEASANRVEGNFIGTDVTGTASLGNAEAGVVINGGTGNVVGGTSTGQANLIAFNGSGVVLFGQGNAVRANSIHSNNNLGIDINDDNVTPNDGSDLDAVQNFPVITFVEHGGFTRIKGQLNSRPDETFVVDLFANSTGDPSGFGEGQRYLVSVSVTTDADGQGVFDVTVPTSTSPLEAITATATSAGGSTSEFSANTVAPEISIAGAVVTEGGTATFTLTLSSPSTRPVTVRYDTADGSALAPSDYAAQSGVVTFIPGTTQQTVTVDTIDDLLDEDNEDFAVNLSAPAGAIIGVGEGIATIVDNDPEPTFFITDATVDESAGSAVLTVTLSAPSGKRVTAFFSTQDITAVAQQDYLPRSGSQLTFEPGNTVGFISIPIINDSNPEPQEAFRVNLFNAHEQLAATVTVTILADQIDPLDPQVDLNGDGQGFDDARVLSPGGGPQLITSELFVIRDVASGVVASAIARIVDAPAGSDEQLAVDTSGTPIQATYDAQSHTLRLIGAATVETYERVFRTMTYQRASASVSPISRTIEISAAAFSGNIHGQSPAVAVGEHEEAPEGVIPNVAVLTLTDVFIPPPVDPPQPVVPIDPPFIPIPTNLPTPPPVTLIPTITFNALDRLGSGGDVQRSDLAIGFERGRARSQDAVLSSLLEPSRVDLAIAEQIDGLLLKLADAEEPHLMAIEEGDEIVKKPQDKQVRQVAYRESLPIARAQTMKRPFAKMMVEREGWSPMWLALLPIPAVAGSVLWAYRKKIGERYRRLCRDFASWRFG